MRTELRFLLAIALMLVVLIGTNVMFPPVIEPPPTLAPESGEVTLPATPGAQDRELGLPTTTPTEGAGEQQPVAADPAEAGPGAAAEVDQPAVPEREIVVESPLYRFVFSNRGARLISAELVTHPSLRREGPVELVRPGTEGLFGQRFQLNGQTLDLRDGMFEVDPDGGISMSGGGSGQTLQFTYRHPSGAATVEIEYTFDPDSYLVDVSGRATGLERTSMMTDLGRGVAFNEADSVPEAGLMAYVTNHLQDGIRSELLTKVEGPTAVDGPFLWAASKSKFFVVAVLPRSDVGGDYLAGLIAEPGPAGDDPYLAVTHAVRGDGDFGYQLFMGPLEYATLSALGDDLEEVNPYGWKFFRPIVRPFVAAIMFCLNFLHNTLNLGYGWVLILFGVLMRVLLWPLNQKAMRAQMRNMAVQPLMKEIQTKYKDQPEKLQKEMMRLYKEHGFNPLAGCLPMLLPWPVLIALFFVFQNTIQLRGVEFLWLADLSAKDPYYILPVFLAVSMFLLQFISFRSMGQDNPQMKMMMYFMPLFFGFIFMQFASGLNLYYATANVATIPQQIIIARERKKVRAEAPTPKPSG